MKDGGFSLRKWISNSQRLMQWIDHEEGVPITEAATVAEEDQTYATTHLGMKGKTSEERKVLGLNWDITRDAFILRFHWLVNFAKDLPLTKRSVLRVVAKLYDPLGFISPLFITVKILSQDLCKLKTDWDEPLCDELNFKYTSWLSDLMKVQSISIDRCYFHNVRDQVTSLQIHGFGDSSEVAYAATVYLRIETIKGISTRLIMSKTRVAPLTKPTISRLELLAALILARLVQRIREALKPIAQINEVFCWTDSMTTLHWIKGVDREYKQFVQNRVKEIRQLIPSESWNHCPGYEYPADLLSRGISAEALQESEIWGHGPPWLLEGKDKWPNQADVTELSRDYYDEMRPSDKPKSKLIHSTGLVVESRIPSLSSVLDPNKSGDFKRLIRVTAFVLRFLRNTRSKETKKKLVGPLSNEECESVEILWLKEMQKAVVRSPRFENLKQQLGLYSDDNGLLRCRGRLQSASIPFDAKHLILLPVDHHLTVLIIDDCHQRVLHNGAKETLTELKSRFWVPRGRQTVQKVISKCVNCKTTEGKHYAVPPTAPLPQLPCLYKYWN